MITLNDVMPLVEKLQGEGVAIRFRFPSDSTPDNPVTLDMKNFQVGVMLDPKLDHEILFTVEHGYLKMPTMLYNGDLLDLYRITSKYEFAASFYGSQSPTRISAYQYWGKVLSTIHNIEAQIRQTEMGDGLKDIELFVLAQRLIDTYDLLIDPFTLKGVILDYLEGRSNPYMNNYKMGSAVNGQGAFIPAAAALIAIHTSNL